MQRTFPTRFLPVFFLLALLLGACSTSDKPPNQVPTALVSATPNKGQAPLEVSLDASASSDPDGDISSFVWDFGDGSAGTGAQVKHIYAPGTFKAKVTVTDAQGASASAATTVTVTKPVPGNQAPKVSLQATPTSGQAPLSVAFDASASSDPDGSVASVVWAFGDGDSDSGAQVSHTYLSAGVVSAAVTVTDDQGATASATVDITVTEATPGGTISGTITLSGALGSETSETAREKLELPVGATAFSAPPTDAFVPGEVIVKFKPGLGTLAASALAVAGQRLERVRALPVADTYLYRRVPGAADGSQLLAQTAAQLTLQLSAELAQRADIATALPNRIYHALKTPDDTFYNLQWPYPALNLPQAWDVTTGSAETVVAVVDTGILGSATDDSVTHPDFVGRLLPGYDFVSDPDAAGDNDARDDDPYDLGTFQSNGTHGSHVAGIIAANSDDGVGVAGVDWAAKILPVRVLGTKGSGPFSDILDGVAWAAGIEVEGVPTNPHPADVINLSLGGGGPCDEVEKDLFDAVIAGGSVVVVAAGNNNEDASDASPANCDAVITVGAVDFNGQRAPYSNFGGKLDVMAPGGDMGADANNDRQPDGVLSAVYDSNKGGFYWNFLQGTSMAAPHVAGVAALLKAVDPTLTQAEVATLLKTTARPRTAAACNGSNHTGLTAADCGAGLVDAFAAVQAASGSPPPPPTDSELGFTPGRLDFGTTQTAVSLQLGNPGSTSLSWRFDGLVPYPDNPSEVGKDILELSSTKGTIPAGGKKTVTVKLNRGLSGAKGNYHFDLGFVVGSTPQRLPVFFSLGDAAPPAGSLVGTLSTACFVTGDTCDLNKSSAKILQESAASAPYTFADLGAGRYRLIAWKDVNDNDAVDSGDYFGFYSQNGLGATEVVPPAEGRDYAVAVVSSDGASGGVSRELERFLVEAKRRSASQ